MIIHDIQDHSIHWGKLEDMKNQLWWFGDVFRIRCHDVVDLLQSHTDVVLLADRRSSAYMLERFCVVSLSRGFLEMDALLLLSCSYIYIYTYIYICIYIYILYYSDLYENWSCAIRIRILFSVGFTRHHRKSQSPWPGMAWGPWCGNLAKKDIRAIPKAGLPGKVWWRDWLWPGRRCGWRGYRWL